MISIKAYRESSFSEEVRYCANHKSEPVTIGCKIYAGLYSVLSVYLLLNIVQVVSLSKFCSTSISTS